MPFIGAGSRRRVRVWIALDTERCTGHSRCYWSAAGPFGGDDRGYGVVVRPEGPIGLQEQERTAVGNCPETAIALVDRCDPRH
ncbi:MAG: ferredoxin [Acidimicrobiales bacterium]